MVRSKPRASRAKLRVEYPRDSKGRFVGPPKVVTRAGEQVEGRLVFRRDKAGRFAGPRIRVEPAPPAKPKPLGKVRGQRTIKRKLGGKTKLWRYQGSPDFHSLAARLKEIGEARGNPVFVRFRVKEPDLESHVISLPLMDARTFTIPELVEMMLALFGGYGVLEQKITAYQIGEVYD